MSTDRKTQLSTDPANTEHLRCGERITMDELAVHLDAARVWLRQLALAAETPTVPIELGANICDRLDAMAEEPGRFGQNLARADTVISAWQPLRPYLPNRESWGARAHGSDRQQWGKRLSTVLSLHQLLAPVSDDLPWRDEEPGIAYLDGLNGIPGVGEWESARAARRRAAARQAAIQDQAQQERCSTCQAIAGTHRRTENGHIADAYHKPRITRATQVVDEALGEEQ
ncbi:hypothetical protein [Streptosporangium roseum]|uniref:Uncharacterized protein n=2 Tax=Streptosporangium roseum TaxID=2001 RepID=D2B551_STRRD|nr:hypothetical protein [Streptosporangium roseum]ACZ87575.1 hypothetical protein Sros_4734 [Streptosporangium roseum DSM 43021]